MAAVIYCKILNRRLSLPKPVSKDKLEGLTMSELVRQCSIHVLSNRSRFFVTCNHYIIMFLRCYIDFTECVNTVLKKDTKYMYIIKVKKYTVFFVILVVIFSN